MTAVFCEVAKEGKRCKHAMRVAGTWLCGKQAVELVYYNNNDSFITKAVLECYEEK